MAIADRGPGNSIALIWARMTFMTCALSGACGCPKGRRGIYCDSLRKLNPVLLSREQLVELTGYRRPSAMRRWLICEGIKFLIGADGWPKVHEAEIELILTKSEKRRAHGHPDSETLEKWQCGS